MCLWRVLTVLFTMLIDIGELGEGKGKGEAEAEAEAAGLPFRVAA